MASVKVELLAGERSGRREEDHQRRNHAMALGLAGVEVVAVIRTEANETTQLRCTAACMFLLSCDGCVPDTTFWEGRILFMGLLAMGLSAEPPSSWQSEAALEGGNFDSVFS